MPRYKVPTHQTNGKLVTNSMEQAFPYVENAEIILDLQLDKPLICITDV